MLKKLCAVGVFSGVLTGCGYVDEYERQVHAWEPVYCYQSLGAAECYRTPKHADARRLVSYYGPHPSRYEAPPALTLPTPKAPVMVNYWVKDPEPTPRPAPRANASGDYADRPWLTESGRAETEALEVKTALETSATGTRALLRRIADGAAGSTVKAQNETQLDAPSDSAPEIYIDIPEPDTQVR
tara:strand:- start:248 stop:802 length:555 start_codon:yes stop_codon:yes gene_type:complete